MTTYFLRRLVLMVPTFLGVTVIAFFITRIVPGGPIERIMMEMRMGSEGRATLGSEAGSTIPAAALKELERAFDLDKPWYHAYVLWLKKVVTLDLGNSFKYREPVWSLIKSRFPISIVFGLSGFILAYLICIPLGILKALRHRSIFDFSTSFIVFIGYSIPGWAMGALLLVLLASGQFLNWFPLGGVRSHSYEDLPAVVRWMQSRDDVTDDFDTFEWNKLTPVARMLDKIHHMALPVFCYLLGSFAQLTVLTKNSLMDNLGQDYVRTAFAKGLAPSRVILLHTLRNSFIPLATGLGHSISLIMAGSYLIELVFNIQGIGYLGFDAIVGRDYTVVMGVLSVNTLLTLMGNFLSDVIYALVDPANPV